MVHALRAIRRRPLLVLLALLVVPFALPSLGAERRLTREYLVRRSQEVAKAISAARGLPVLAPVRADLLTRSDLVDLVRLRMNQETPPEEIRAEGVLLERLGVIDSASEYEQQLYDMFEQQIAGLYDPDDKTLYVLTDWNGRGPTSRLARSSTSAGPELPRRRAPGRARRRR